MKKISNFFGILLLSVLVFSSVASADLIPPNSHHLDRCVTISNIDQYPNIVLIGFITPVSGEKYRAYVIENNKCLTKGYKFNEFSIYWVTKNQFSTIDLNNLKMSDDKVANSSERDEERDPVYYHVYTPAGLNLVAQKIDPVSGFVSDSNPAVKENIEYSIGSVNGNILTLYMSKKTTQYNNGTPQKIEVFTTSETVATTTATSKSVVQKSKSTPTQTSANDMVEETPDTIQPVVVSDVTIQKGFWQSVSCFFTKILGGSCR